MTVAAPVALFAFKPVQAPACTGRHIALIGHRTSGVAATGLATGVRVIAPGRRNAGLAGGSLSVGWTHASTGVWVTDMPRFLAGEAL